MSQPKIAIAVTADDKTAKGFASAEKRAGRTVGEIGKSSDRWARDAQAAVSRSGRGMVGTLGRVEQASARVFGGRSITSGVTSRLSALGEAAGEARLGMVGAAQAGGLLEGAAAGVGIAVGATVGILAAAGYAAFKLANGWAEGAASIGRTAQTIGVATKALQEFEAAGERAGMNKGAATGTLGSMSQVLNDARYGRNSGALAVLGRMGVSMATNADGTVDVKEMALRIADGLSKQNSSGARTAAGALGIGLDALPFLRQGRAKVAADMVDGDTHAAMIDDAGIATGQRIARKGVMVGQLKDRAFAEAGGATAGAIEGGYDAVLNGGRALADGTASFGGIVSRTFAPAADKVERGGRAIERAAAGLTAGTISMFQRIAGRHGQRTSLMLAQYGLESGYGRSMPKGSNNPFGIKARPGEPFVWAPTTEQDKSGRGYRVMAKFRKFDSLEDAAEARARLLDSKRYAATKHAGSADEAADAVAAGGYATDVHYAAKLKRQIHDHGLARYDQGAPAELPVRVDVHLHGGRAGDRATVRAGTRGAPAVSHAMQH